MWTYLPVLQTCTLLPCGLGERHERVVLCVGNAFCFFCFKKFREKNQKNQIGDRETPPTASLFLQVPLNKDK